MEATDEWLFKSEPKLNRAFWEGDSLAIVGSEPSAGTELKSKGLSPEAGTMFDIFGVDNTSKTGVLDSSDFAGLKLCRDVAFDLEGADDTLAKVEIPDVFPLLTEFPLSRTFVGTLS